MVEVSIDGTTYRCYRTWCVDPEWNGPVDSYIIAGLGTVSVERDSGAVVATAPVISTATPLLERLGPHIAERARATRDNDCDRDAAE